MLTCFSSELPESGCLIFETEKMKKDYNVNVFLARESTKFIHFEKFPLRVSCTHGNGEGNAQEAKANHCNSHGDFSCKIFCKEYLIFSYGKAVIPLYATTLQNHYK